MCNLRLYWICVYEVIQISWLFLFLIYYIYLPFIIPIKIVNFLKCHICIAWNVILQHKQAGMTQNSLHTREVWSSLLLRIPSMSLGKSKTENEDLVSFLRCAGSFVTMRACSHNANLRLLMFPCQDISINYMYLMTFSNFEENLAESTLGLCLCLNWISSPEFWLHIIIHIYVHYVKSFQPSRVHKRARPVI